MNKNREKKVGKVRGNQEEKGNNHGRFDHLALWIGCVAPGHAGGRWSNHISNKHCWFEELR